MNFPYPQRSHRLVLLLAVLPGSRQQEIDRHWSIFIEVINRLRDIFPNIQFVLGKAPNVTILDCPKFVHIEKNDIRSVMSCSTAGIIASGTATLEAAILGLPAIVCYKSSALTYRVGKFLAKVKYLSLINLIAERKIVPEFIQMEMTPDSIIKAIIPLLSDPPDREKMLSGYAQVADKLGERNVYLRAAQLIVNKSF